MITATVQNVLPTHLIIMILPATIQAILFGLASGVYVLIVRMYLLTITRGFQNETDDI